jgi:hypothetical protein
MDIFCIVSLWTIHCIFCDTHFFDDFKHWTNLKKSIFSNLSLAMSSLWWKMCFTILIQIPWFIFRLSEEMFCSVSPDWKVWVVRHACTCASFWSSITCILLLVTYPSFHEVCKKVVHTYWPCKPRTHVFTVLQCWNILIF